mmetsp:Transcript_29992/g.69797  ORF Transcript_29992/g.69797 Transcript_29992/m.69797 type:complete len:248 (+) Transcript_29992:110-853(+)
MSESALAWKPCVFVNQMTSSSRIVGSMSSSGCESQYSGRKILESMRWKRYSESSTTGFPVASSTAMSVNMANMAMRPCLSSASGIHPRFGGSRFASPGGPSHVSKPPQDKPRSPGLTRSLGRNTSAAAPTTKMAPNKTSTNCSLTPPSSVRSSLPPESAKTSGTLNCSLSSPEKISARGQPIAAIMASRPCLISASRYCSKLAGSLQSPAGSKPASPGALGTNFRYAGSGRNGMARVRLSWSLFLIS